MEAESRCGAGPAGECQLAMRLCRPTDSRLATDDDLRPLEALAFLVWSLISFYVAAWVIGEKLFLVSIYGWSRVHHEHLAILHMPKHSPWPVSNGDFIDSGKTGLHTFITIVLTFASIIAFFLLLRVLRLHRAARSGSKQAGA